MKEQSLLLLLDGGLFPVELDGLSKFNSVEGYDEVVGEDDLEQQSREHGAGAKQQAEQVLLEAEFDGLEGFASVLDHGELDDDGADEDDQEKFVVEEVFKYVVFLSLQLSGIDLVEDLQQHEHVEEDRIVFSGLIVPVSHTD